jgi:dihydrofolate reductase
MGKLICSGIMSLDGYIADDQGDFSWAAPDEEVHTFVNELERSVGTYLYGRRMYEVMRYWDTADEAPEQPEVEREYTALWKAADKIVYSSTLDQVTTPRTRLERQFDPEALQRMKAVSERDLTISGPNLAAHAIRAGLVDEFRMFLSPVFVGGGTRFLPDGVHVRLERIEERPFDNGFVFLRYRIREGDFA